MSTIHAHAVLLKRCRIPRSTGMLVGSTSQSEIKNARAMEILHGMIKQVGEEKMNLIMRIEMGFMKTRERYLKRRKSKGSLLNRAVHLAKTGGFEQEYVDYIEKRRKIFLLTIKGNFEEEKSVCKEINGILQGENEETQRILSLEVATEERTKYFFKEIDLFFPNKEILDLFTDGKYKEVLSILKNNEHFDSVLICAICRVEIFLKGLSQIRERDVKGKGRVERYCAQWSSLYQKTLDLFSSNFISEEYLKEAGEKIPLGSFSSVPLHPITYDISSMYLCGGAEEEKGGSPRLSEMFQRLNIFTR